MPLCRVAQHRQIRDLLDELLDPCLELHPSNYTSLETEVS
jgi:hypothetical protein